MLSLVASGDFRVITSPYADDDWTTSIKFWDSSSPGQELYRNMTHEMRQIIQNDNVIYFNHQTGVLPSDFIHNANLFFNYSILTVHSDKNGSWIIDSFEHKNFPIFGL